MKFFAKAMGLCAVGAILGCAQAIGAQTPSRTHIRVDPSEVAASDLLTAAKAAVDRQDYPTAARDYQDYLANKPDDASVHYDLGYVYTAMQRPGDAKAQYEKAIALDPKMGQAYMNLGLTLLGSDAGAAVEPLEKAAELAPDEARPKLVLGWALERSGKLQDAITQYQAAEKLDANDFDTRFSLGGALLSAGQPGDAEAEFRAALALKQDSAEAHLGLARSLIAQKKRDAGAAELATYLEARPEDAGARREHAALLDELGKDDDALAELDRADGGGPESLDALMLRSEIDFHKARYGDAVSTLQKAAALAPQNADVAARLGHVYLLNKEYPQAVNELTLALKMDQSANDVLGDLAVAEYQSKNYSAALAYFDVLSRRKDLPAGSWFFRATCYDKLGQKQAALDAYRKFLELNRDQTSDMYFEASARVRTLAREIQKR